MSVTIPAEVEIRDGVLLVRAQGPGGDTIVLNLDMNPTNRMTLIDQFTEDDGTYEHTVEVDGHGTVYGSLEGADAARVFADLIRK